MIDIEFRIAEQGTEGEIAKLLSAIAEM